MIITTEESKSLIEIQSLKIKTTARKIFEKCPKVKEKLWGGEFGTDGYFASTVGKHGNEEMIGKYVKNQGGEYQQIHKDTQLKLF